MNPQSPPADASSCTLIILGSSCSSGKVMDDGEPAPWARDVRLACWVMGAGKTPRKGKKVLMFVI